MGIAYVLWILVPVAWAALSWLPPSRTAGRVLAVLQLFAAVAALIFGMPAENIPWWFLVPGVVSNVLRLTV
ncbi:hypothetical protein OH809_16865 [Streptomyces sp. NBC_00873]|uniref:hypothetical protein n=1 Tax=unclassified Streptomyces TaxID=2593676 RepID=UPI0038708EB8|nr:hypothetical protein OH809_16865 [Streptomyces sp. NBC_00873]WTA45788.1 hypothetical protein OH821_26820 [Streptomyces sp. NBC_00842]